MYGDNNVFPNRLKDENTSAGIGNASLYSPEARQKREQDLAEVVHNTGDNLIDISSVEQPEVIRGTVGRKTASQFKEEFLKEIPLDSKDVSDQPASSIIPLIDQIHPRSLSADAQKLLERVSKEAQEAYESEPVVKLVGDLLLIFE